MKFIHIADIHASRERLWQTLHILETLIERCKKGDIDFILFAGDFWDSTITATKGSGFSDIISAIRELEKHVYRIYFIYGTPSHEPLGSLSAFASDTIQVTSRMSYCACDKFEIIAIPEPRRSDYVGQSIKETDDSINKSVKEFIKAESKRHIFSDKKVPRIVVYHGEVKGAVYQNGASASSPTAIPKELLQELDADYYAFGHIHMPQEVFKNAWYSGSACPKNFGEVHDGCYHLVTLGEKTDVERVSFGLPVYETFSVSLKDLDKINADFTNKNIRLQFECTKEERKSLSVRKLQNEIKERTDAVSVKLEPAVVEPEKARTSLVSKRKSAVEKMTEYAKEKSLKIPGKAKELLQEIQDNTLIKYSYPQHSFELLSLSLRGAIGIRDGQHKENFDLDFERLDDGVVCLVGECGRGKSCLLENCHPYPCMLTRDGTLKEHFYLKDSHRILVYKDETGLFYRISMLIDGKTQSGKSTYFVETSRDRETWESLPETDGSLDAYKEWVNGTFGSIDVFLRTAFFAKEQTKNATDISATTKGERMEFLSKLAGTDHLKEISVIAREQRKSTESSASAIKIEIESYSRYKDMLVQNEQDIISWKEELENLERHTESLEKEVSELRMKDMEYQRGKATSESNKALYAQYKKEYDEKKESYEAFKSCVSHKNVFDKIQKHNKILEETKPLIEQKEKEISAKQAEHDGLQNELVRANKILASTSLEVEKVNSSIVLCKSYITDVDDVCPTCGQPISGHKKKELQSQVNRSKKELAGLGERKERLQEVYRENKSSCDALDSKTRALNKELSALESELKELESKKEECESYIEQFDQLYTEYSYDEICRESERLENELEELQGKMDDIVDCEAMEDVSEELEEKESELKENLSRKSELSATIKTTEGENERYRNELTKVSAKEKEVKELDERISAYLFIEDAFSNNGIPAIELRESAPEIADIANKILKDSYGNKFEIRFGATSELKTKRKANEDFNILVYDSENGDEKTIDLVSSGERIWIKQALFYAFSIVQMNRTGFNFRTRLIDESDGSLDGGLRPKYLQMVTSAHRIADSRVTILITHSQEIKDIASQIIEI